MGTGSLIWHTLRTFLRCYENSHGKDEMEQRLYHCKWNKTVPETMSSFNEVVHIWKQTTQQTVTLHFARQVDMPTPHAILDQIVKKMPPWAKKHIQEHPVKYTTGNIQAMTVIPHDREQRATILTMAEAILAEETEHVDGGSPVTPGYGDMTVDQSMTPGRRHYRPHLSRRREGHGGSEPGDTDGMVPDAECMEGELDGRYGL